MEGLGRSIADWLDDALLGRGLKHPEFLRLTRHALDIYVQVALNRSSEPGDPSLIAVLSDATELKTLEAQFVQSQKCSLLDNWLAALRMILIIFSPRFRAIVICCYCVMAQKIKITLT